MGVFTFLKLYKWYQIVQRITLKINRKLQGYSQCSAQIKEFAV